ncbi:MAG: FAD-dependent oxidoreductase [Rhodopirellula sp.]|nr:FAD-dependent oxidoreductase [Rhodopirellula sp.]
MKACVAAPLACVLGLLTVAGPIAPAPAATVLVEAESFRELGGWVADAQVIDQMGSTYLLAHGMGVPVKDASTTVDLPRPGKYRVLVRTRNWVAGWAAPETAPGKFQVLIDGRALEPIFGTKRDAWHWQDGGEVEISKNQAALSLHDLTGFEGRCDAIVLTTDPAWPPNRDPEMYQWRREALGLPKEPQDAGDFDLVVVGGGLSGCCAAVSAARLGVNVALLQDRPVLGGNNSSEIRQSLLGQYHQKPYPRLGDVVEEINPLYLGNKDERSDFDDAKKLRILQAEKNLRVFLNTSAFRVDMEEGRIRAVVGRDTMSGREKRFPGRWFADCTGDGTLGWLSGADFRMGREGRPETAEQHAPDAPDFMIMGATIKWSSAEEQRPCPFPECPWAIQFTEESCQKTGHGWALSGDWNWEFGIGDDQIRDVERIRDRAFRVIYGQWAFVKNHAPDKGRYANHRLTRVAYIAGKRESRRLLGDVLLTAVDILNAKPYPDACVTVTHNIDLHHPVPENSRLFPGEEFRSYCKGVQAIEPYALPYRCLYSRNVPNLFMAGRDISVSHVALGSVRVMRTCGMMGEVVGMAASLCKTFDCTPRDVYAKHFDKLQELMSRGVGRQKLRTP